MVWYGIVVFNVPLAANQEQAQLYYVTEYFAKSLQLTQGHSK